MDVGGIVWSGRGVGVARCHVGLRGMRGRVEIMKGTLEIDTGADGTRVEGRFPIE